MDESQHDKVFVRTFGIVLGALLGLMFAIMFIAALISDSDEVDPLVLERIEERLQPVGTVVTDPAALVKVSAAAAPAEPRSGKQVTETVCAACHGAGVLGAIKIGDKAAWSAQSVDAFTASAIKGKNAMPARGGDPSLSDAEVRVAVEYMREQSGV